MNCIVYGCCNKAFRRGYCSKHYKQILECGDVYKTKYEERQEFLCARKAEIIHKLKCGASRADVCKMFDISLHNLKWIIKQSGDDTLRIEQAMSDEQIRQKIVANGLPFEYAGEYKRGSHVLLKCNQCGCVVRYGATAIFKKKLQCKECKRIEKEQRQQQAEQEKAERAAATEQARAEAEKQRTMQHEARRRESVCPVCGESFITYKAKQITCSPECGRKRANIRHTRRKDTRISKDKRIDKISLDVLFRRDSGVCHICGKQCDWNDYTQTDTAFIAGNLYPSVDHVVPVSLGGADEWNNVKLAHMLCNSKRGNIIE